MARIIITIGLALLLSLSLPPTVATAQPLNTTEDSGAPMGPRKQLATIIFAGLAGAILGLSTLSFYGRPQDKLSNIAIGFAVGVIVGTGYTTYKAATRPYQPYGFHELWSEPLEESKELAAMNPTVPAFQMNWSF